MVAVEGVDMVRGRFFGCALCSVVPPSATVVVCAKRIERVLLLVEAGGEQWAVGGGIGVRVQAERET